jgi:hypothetical protein
LEVDVSSAAAAREQASAEVAALAAEKSRLHVEALTNKKLLDSA